eukprot:m.28762 g.28762  ORF g.28762 m.28762 type:complete len:331 (+) comp15979_c0_seq1:274-1266(+)
MDELLKIGQQLDKEPDTKDGGDGMSPDDPFLTKLLGGLDKDDEGFAAAMAAAALNGGEDFNMPISQMVEPTPGTCVKTEADTGEKVFVNVCHSDKIPAPPSISDERLAIAIATGDNREYQVPMSVGEPHAELDNAKKGCTCYDVIICTEAYKEFKERPGIQEFLIELTFAHIEHKHSVLLSRAYKILGKRTHVGTIKAQHCRIRSKIREVSAPPNITTSQPSTSHSKQTSKAVGITEVVESNGEVPEYSMMKEPESGVPEFYIVEVELPTVRSTKPMTLDIGDTRFELSVHPRKYFLGLDFEHPVDHTATGAQFNKKTRKLTVTMPVAAH